MNDDNGRGCLPMLILVLIFTAIGYVAGFWVTMATYMVFVAFAVSRPEARMRLTPKTEAWIAEGERLWRSNRRQD